MTIKFANNVSTTLANSALVGQTTMEVASVAGFPTLILGDYFYGTLTNNLGAIEIVEVTSIAGNILTCVRGAEGTAPQDWTTGATFEIRVTAAGLTKVMDAPEVVEEVQTATSGQTVFTLTTFMYAPGENTLSVYLDGINQIVGLSYEETSPSAVTFADPMRLGALVKFTTLRTNGITTSSAVVTYEPAGTGAVPTTVQAKLRERISVIDFGADPTGVEDSAAAIEAAITHASISVSSGQGSVVYFPVGTFCISRTIMMPTRVGLQGANGRGTVIKPHPSFTDGYMFHAVNGTSSMFGSYIKDMYINARGYNMLAVVYSQAWQETSGLDRVVIEFDGTTPAGFKYTDGYGGAAFLPLKDLEIFADSTAVNSYGVYVDQVSLVGGFVLSVENTTISGSAANPLAVGIAMVKDSLAVRTLHSEYISTMVSVSGAGSLSIDTMTGAFNAVVDMVTIGSGFTGTVNLRNMIPNGATGQLFRDNITGRNIPASMGMLAEYTYQPSSFLAALSADIPNITGNGTEYTIIFDDEVHDYRGEYNAITGVFTALRSGKYLFSAVGKFNYPVGSTTSVFKLVTTARTYEIARGGFNTIRDGSNNLAFCGAVVADMNAGHTARVTITVLGLGANTVDVISGTSGASFGGQWLAR